MAITKKRSNFDDDSFNVGPDATATFDNSRSNPAEHASSENLDAIDDEDEDEDEDDDDNDDEDLDEEEEEEEEEYDEEEDSDDEEDNDDDEEDVDEDENEIEDDLGKGPKAPSVYRKV